jgi:lipopolysaccharide transport system permease protein
VTDTELEVREAAPPPVPPLRDDSRTARTTVIRPSPRWPRLDFGELWHYRELLLRFVWRDVSVRYKQTFIGIAWALIVPTMQMVVFTLVFGKFANFPSKDVPYPIFTYSALLPWTYFAGALSLSSSSLVSNTALVTKVYFPRVLLPLAGVLTPFVDFLLALFVLFGLMLWFGIWPGTALVLAPLFLVLASATALGVGLFLSAVNVRYRDVPYVIPFLIQIWLYVSGVIYPISALPGKWQWLLSVNPMTAVISGFQWGVLDTPPPNWAQFAVSVAAAATFALVGLAYFRRSEPRFADTI